MQRRATKQSPGPSKRDRDFIAWVKEQPCCCCNCPAPSIADHVFGSSVKKVIDFVRVQCGLYAVIPLCATCDSVKTRGNRRALDELLGVPANIMWLSIVNSSAWVDKFSDIEKRAVLEAR